MRVLNLYAGLGGNRSGWPTSAKVTAVELDEAIAEVYAREYPSDDVVVGDALSYLEHNFLEYDFIWSSPPLPVAWPVSAQRRGAWQRVCADHA